MANGWMPEVLDKERLSNEEGSPCHLLPDTSTLTDRQEDEEKLADAPG